MIFSSELEKLMPSIKAIPDKEVKTPTISVGILVQEAYNLYHWAQTDKPLLIERGMPPELLNNLLLAAKACAEMQSRWFTIRNTDAEATQKWKITRKNALKMRTELFHEFSFAFKNNDELMSVIKSLKKGEGDPDLIQDLHTLASLGNDHLDLLSTINFDVEKLNRAKELSRNLSTLFAQSQIDTHEKEMTLHLRNQTYALLSKRLKEVRNFGKFILKDQTDRLFGYELQYRNAKRKDIE